MTSTFAKLDPEDIGKLFIGGLNSMTTKESLKNYFSQFGEVIDSVVMKNAETGRSRGFGFITFRDPNCVLKVLQINSHELDGKRIDPKECTPRSMQKIRKQAGKCKVFLGGLPPDITEEDIRSGMSKFGKVDQVIIMYDQETKKCRGFGFLSFELEESIEQACAEHFVIINDKQIECKKAEPRVRQKILTQSFGSPKHQNGFVSQASYGQMTPMIQGGWNVPPNQSLYNLQGSSVANYQTCGNSGMLSFNASSPAYPSMQQFSYVQSYPTNYGTPLSSYSYSPISNNAYASQTAVPSYSQVSDLNGSNSSFTVENEKQCGSIYAQSSSSYGPSKGAHGSGSGVDAIFNNQSAISSPNYQRYHPYKV